MRVEHTTCKLESNHIQTFNLIILDYHIVFEKFFAISTVLARTYPCYTKLQANTDLNSSHRAVSFLCQITRQHKHFYSSSKQSNVPSNGYLNQI